MKKLNNEELNEVTGGVREENGFVIYDEEDFSEPWEDLDWKNYNGDLLDDWDAQRYHSHDENGVVS